MTECSTVEMSVEVFVLSVSDSVVCVCGLKAVKMSVEVAPHANCSCVSDCVSHHASGEEEVAD